MPIKNTLADLRDHLFEQIERLKDEQDPEKLQAELERSKAVVHVAGALIDTAKVEVEMVRALEATAPGHKRFFNIPDDERRLPELKQRRQIE